MSVRPQRYGMHVEVLQLGDWDISLGYLCPGKYAVT